MVSSHLNLIDDLSLMFRALFVSVCQSLCACMGCDVMLLAKSVSLDGCDKIEQKATYAFKRKNGSFYLNICVESERITAKTMIHWVTVWNYFYMSESGQDMQCVCLCVFVFSQRDAQCFQMLTVLVAHQSQALKWYGWNLSQSTHYCLLQNTGEP